MEHSIQHHASNCLNCGAALATPFCGQCGQTSHTHRFSLKHFFTHDLVHGLFHVDRGFFYTIGRLFTKPGITVREYINGKRVSYFNYFTMMLLVITVWHLANGLTDVRMKDFTPVEMKETVTQLDQFMMKYPKITNLATIPVFALFSMLFFRRSGLNFAEHLVLNTYRTAAVSIIVTVFTIITIFVKQKAVLVPLYNLMTLGTVIYSVCFFYHCFNDAVYSKKGRLFRSIVVSLSLSILIAIATVFMIGMSQGFTDGK